MGKEVKQRTYADDVLGRVDRSRRDAVFLIHGYRYGEGEECDKKSGSR